MTKHLFPLLLFVIVAGYCDATDWYVNNKIGDDSLTGQAPVVNDKNGPFKTIQLAVNKANAGDTINLANTGIPYRQTVAIKKGGKKGAPLTLDGHGAEIWGSESCPKQGWTKEADGVYSRQDLTSNVFIIVDGKMLLWSWARDALAPGEFCYETGLLYYYPPTRDTLKTASITVKTKTGDITLDAAKWQRCHSSISAVRRYRDLEPPESITVNGNPAPFVTAREKLAPGQWCTSHTGTSSFRLKVKPVVYYRPPNGITPKQQNIEFVVRENGVYLYGEQEYSIVKNLMIRYVANDGFNIHNNVTNAEFYNCNAMDCGDEGFSAHDNCGTLLDGAVYVNCDNGIANVNLTGYSHTRNVILVNARHVGYMTTKGKTATHTLTNAIIIDNPSQLSMYRTQAENILIVKTPSMKGKAQAVVANSECALKNAAIIGNDMLLNVSKDTRLSLVNTIFGPSQKGVHARTDNPEACFAPQGVMIAPDLKMEWGARYPWKNAPLATWFAERYPQGDIKPLMKTIAVSPEGTLGDALPLGRGCPPRLIKLYDDYIKKSKR